MAINQNQIKISVLAKDFNIKSKDIVDILAACGIDRKTSGTVGPDEFSLFFDRLTVENQITNMSDYLAGKADIERPKATEAEKTAEAPNVEEKEVSETHTEKAVEHEIPSAPPVDLPKEKEIETEEKQPEAVVVPPVAEIKTERKPVENTDNKAKVQAEHPQKPHEESMHKQPAQSVPRPIQMQPQKPKEKKEQNLQQQVQHLKLLFSFISYIFV